MVKREIFGSKKVTLHMDRRREKITLRVNDNRIVFQQIDVRDSSHFERALHVIENEVRGKKKPLVMLSMVPFGG